MIHAVTLHAAMPLRRYCQIRHFHAMPPLPLPLFRCHAMLLLYACRHRAAFDMALC